MRQIRDFLASQNVLKFDLKIFTFEEDLTNFRTKSDVTFYFLFSEVFHLGVTLSLEGTFREDNFIVCHLTKPLICVCVVTYNSVVGKYGR